ncbi:MAG: hypothetical protein HQL03_12160 [Nitrospirae bacterium]|nr:hypothetical protein [Nitrospirota bacterium]MBF0591229.1 hypothetical protein [Nitrospirota bacterium]
MKVFDVTQLWITCERPLGLSDGRAIRGFWGNRYKNRPEFHGHKGNECVYRHPLIQYKVFGGSALVIGLKEGAYLLRAVDDLDFIEIYHEICPVIKSNMSTQHIQFGTSDAMVDYAFMTPWLGLNEENYKRYLTLKRNGLPSSELLERILIGNILSMSKAVGYVVSEELMVKATLQEGETIRVKTGVELMSFIGGFQVNFLMPDLWGIGKFSSRGYGTTKKKASGR